MPDSVNEHLQDAATRHAVWLIRFGGAKARELFAVLDEAAADLEKRLAGRISALPAAAGDPLQQASVKRLQAILADIRAQNADLATALESDLRADLIELAKFEVDIADRRINESVGVDLGNFRPPPETLRAIVDGPLVRAQTLKQWFRKLTTDRAARLESATRVGLISGDTTPQIIRRFREVENVTKRSAEALVRTNVNHVANSARESLYAANGDVIKGVRWVSTLDGRTSAICRARDGEIYDANEGPRPPAHPNCLPGDSLILAGGRVTGASKRWFEGSLVTIRTVRGREFSATPNHPVLTDRGWVGVGILNRGDKMFCLRNPKAAAASIDTCDDNVVSTIHDKAEAFFRSGNVSTMPVPTTAPDFHGDGAGSEIAIIGADSRLPVERQADFIKEGGDLSFDSRHRREAFLFAFSSFGKVRQSSFHAADSVMGRRRENGTLGGAVSVHPRLLLLASIAERNAPVAQDSLHGTWADAEFIRDPSNADTFGIEIDDVALVKVSNFSGHVYNLETAKHVYFSNGIITHNCRSTVTPVTKSWGELGASSLTPGRGSRDFDTLLKKQLADMGMSPEQMAHARGNIRSSLDGGVPAKTTYGEWLRKQPVAFQDDVLGTSKGKLFRDGKLPMDRFVDMQSGREFTLDELKRREAEAWAKAGL